MLVVWAVAFPIPNIYRPCGGEGSRRLVFQVNGMDVVQGEPLTEVFRQLPPGWKAANPAARAFSLGAGCWWTVV